MQAILPESALSDYPSGFRELIIVLIFVAISCFAARIFIRPAAAVARSKRKFH